MSDDDRIGKTRRIAETLKGTLGPEMARALRPHLAKAVWADVVGPQVAGVTQPSAIRGGSVLYVRVKNAVWANELTLMRGDIMVRLNKALGGQVLTDIVFGASGLPATKRPRKVSPLPARGELDEMQLDKQSVAKIDQTVIEAADPELQERLKRSLIRAAQSDRWRRAHGWKPCARCGTPAFPTGADVHLCGICRIEENPL